ncbi:MAG TPA: UDP-N-acetylmuramoyl-tripeptide--D-alanyl-D-alanine ligase [Fimbriimonadaceae bacterium]|nr:UDP-N-acetylmuramoyl-tripeptide--D-alanyl-D-alanine ligase [Fimbriimonadaceae bacterium]
MRKMTLGEFASRCKGALHATAETEITGFATDHREVKAGDLFIAIRGARVDGHTFAAEAISSGAVACLVESAPAGDMPHILVDNVAEGLAAFARSLRGEFTGHVVGVTGSSGKTSTKEFLAAALSPLGPVLKTEGNRNSEWTSPLIWAELLPEHRSVVVEMGMRGFGQIRHLCSFAQPNIGVITNIGYSHLEQVGSREGIATAKGELLEALPSNGTAVLWAEDEYLSTLRGKTGARVVTFGRSAGADCRVEHYRALSLTKSWIKGTCLGQPFEGEFATVGWHQAINAAAAIAAAVAAGVEADEAAKQLSSAQLPPMRMEIVNLNGAIVLLDNYNASFPGMLAAIETLRELPTMGRKMAVLGEMRELGEFTISAHQQVGKALVEANLYKVMFYGMPMTFARRELVAAGARDERTPFATELQDITEFLRELDPGDLVLIKGSRALEIEKALQPLLPATAGGAS